MKEHLIAILIITALISSCAKSKKTVYLKAENVDGLTNKAAVTVNGFVIGKVVEIDLDKSGHILLKLYLDENPEIPSDSKFIIENRDLLGMKGISISLGKSKTNISANDTVITTPAKTALQSDSLTTKVQDLFKNLTGATQRDSVLIELRRLNKNLEELKRDK